MLDRLKRRLDPFGNRATEGLLPSDALLQDLLLDAESYIQQYTGRDSVSPLLQGVQVALATVACNRLGMEGESSHSEGGVSLGVDLLPSDLRRALDAQRLAKVGEG